MPQLIDGSSPLTRGKREGGRRHPLVQGLIPAHAGKTNGPAPSPGRGRAHPRSRGENAPMIVLIWLKAGSSPLTRGKLSPHKRARDFAGLIPAHAGKTAWSRSRSARSRAHPRSRGENSAVSRVDTLNNGSSPLTRGKLYPFVIQPQYRGLIPAHAGKTKGGAMHRPKGAAHPRSRGENA